ncbi:dihydrolipoyl dehydrogenase [Bacillus kwashiorkori]|uniref:dihydrolipoyl dehydrogenase n=1 Tax=Bacillus kwashiorkori TaxID=1522318 RepID=UPI000784DE97|nr:dihydrolipoyl dehydrogenase [Bacillus kwashiorkori]
MAKEYDLVIVGGGTGGYVAAIKASQYGLKTAIVEKDKLGGTCLHQGCIPSKTLLKSAEVYRLTKESEKFGIDINSCAIDFAKIQERKTAVINQLHQGVIHLMKKGKIDVFHGTGRILGPSIFSPLPGTVSVEMDDGSENEMLIPKNVIIATGSRPRTLPGLEIDGKTVITSDEALAMEKLPKSMIIVGGGVIGIEWASMLADLDVDVTVIEYAERILPTEDVEISREMTRLLKKRKVTIHTKAKLLPDTLEKNSGVSVQFEKGGTNYTVEAEKLLVSVGRQANIEGIGLENTDIVINNGVISVNEFYQTKESHIYAIGDCIGGLQLAHVATKEGLIAVSHIAGKNPSPLNYTNVPKCIYSYPEAASIGLTEQEAKEKGYELKVGKFPFKAIGKALVNGEADGFTKIIVDKNTEDLLGIHMIGSHVTDLISEASLATYLDATAWEIGDTIHPHPTLSEVFNEASLAVDGKAIHF